MKLSIPALLGAKKGFGTADASRMKYLGQVSEYLMCVEYTYVEEA
jgi:hypothetical protein